MALFISVLNLKAVQTSLVKSIVEGILKNSNNRVEIGEVDISFFGDCIFKEIFIPDHHNDTLVYIPYAKIDFRSYGLVDKTISIKEAVLREIYLKMKYYKGEDKDNLREFLYSLSDSNRDSIPSIDKNLFEVDKIRLINSKYSYIDESLSAPVIIADNINSTFTNVFLRDSLHVDIKINSLEEVRGVNCTNLQTSLVANSEKISFTNTKLSTSKSDLNLAHIDFNWGDKPVDSLKMDIVLNKSKISMAEIGRYIPSVKSHESLHVSGIFKGPISDFKTGEIKISSIDNTDSSTLKMHLKKQGKGYGLKIDLLDLNVNYDRCIKLVPQLDSLMPNLTGTERFNIAGYMYLSKDSISIRGEGTSTIGDFSIRELQLIDNRNYNGKINIKNFNLSSVVKDIDLQNVTGEINLYGSDFEKEKALIYLKSNILSADYNGYSYRNMQMEMDAKKGLYSIWTSVNDPKARIRLTGILDMRGLLNKYDLEINFNKFLLFPVNLSKEEGVSISSRIRARLEGNEIKNMTGSVVLRNTYYGKEGVYDNFNDLSFISSINNGRRFLSVKSGNDLQGRIEGKFNYVQILDLVKNSIGKMYKNYRPVEVDENQQISFKFKLNKLHLKSLLPNFIIGSEMEFAGNIDGDKNDMKISLYSDKVSLDNISFDNIVFNFDTKSKHVNTYLSADGMNIYKYRATKLELLSSHQNDSISILTTVNLDKYNKGISKIIAYQTFDKEGRFVLGLNETHLYMGDETWIFDKKNNSNFVMDVDTYKGVLSNTSFRSDDKSVNIKGAIKSKSDKYVHLSAKNLSLKSISKFFLGTEISGIINGDIRIHTDGEIYKPLINIGIDQIVWNDMKYDRMSLNTKFNHNTKSNYTKIDITDKNKRILVGRGHFYYLRNNKNINMTLMLSDIDLSPMNYYTKLALDNIRGKAYGHVNIGGSIGAPKFYGTLKLKNAGLKQPFIGVDFSFEEDSKIYLKDDKIHIDKINLEDTKYKTKYQLLGDLSHNSYRDWELSLKILFNNGLLLNTTYKDNKDYNGILFASGRVNITGKITEPSIDVVASTNNHTVINIPLRSNREIKEYNFINFKKDEKEEISIQKTETTGKGLDFKLDLKVTQDALAKIIFSPSVGDVISARGEGDMTLDVNSMGKFNIYGSYIIREGLYKFTLGNILNVDFKLQEDSSISWNGLIEDADLDITGTYKLSANTSPITLENYTEQSKSVNVQLKLGLNKKLNNPEFKLDIDLLDAGDELKNRFNNLMEDNPNNKKNQFLSLLTMKTFIPVSDNINEEFREPSNTPYRVLADQFSSFLSTLSDEFDFKLDYIDNYKTDENSSKLLEVGISTRQFFKNRVKINSQFRMPVGADKSNKILPELDAEVSISNDGKIKLKTFSRHNKSINSTLPNGFTNGVGISIRKDF
ncbi:hypothetical protein JBKA6_0461 [Ichthyobacterium seriolicida]|uniref:Translocation and assembly module TamB C-terminal domain-containing protein n=2 Tax=Ichthyobacterium seriolicida TaxID=242600 RepID=A0A1J1DX99_9FLAO|nr:hypothetical protein JBKA6_0461 [Ichthyobacterium seriolicida]